jgi:hypothetical protein
VNKRVEGVMVASVLVLTAAIGIGAAVLPVSAGSSGKVQMYISALRQGPYKSLSQGAHIGNLAGTAYQDSITSIFNGTNIWYCFYKNADSTTGPWLLLRPKGVIADLATYKYSDESFQDSISAVRPCDELPPLGRQEDGVAVVGGEDGVGAGFPGF